MVTLPELILIDDDSLIHTTWSYAAEFKRQKLQCYFSLKEFLRDPIPHHIPIYVDFFLPGSINGVEIIQHLRGLGYKHLYLTTGFEREHLNISDTTIQCVDKDYPL